MADQKPNLDSWLDDPQDTPFPAIKDVDAWLDEPAAEAQPQQIDVDAFLDTPEDSWATAMGKTFARTPDLIKQQFAGLMQRGAETPSPVPTLPGREEQHALAERLMGRAPEQRAEDSAHYAKMYADATADLQENAPNVDPDSLKGFATML